MIFDLPANPVAAEIKWTLRQPSQSTRGEFTSARRVTILPQAPRWSAEVKYPTITGERRFLPWRAALARLQGRAHAFRLVAVENPQRIPIGATPPAIDGAGQQGSMVKTRGWVPGTALLAGWFVSFGGALYQVLNAPIAGDDGKMIVELLPQIVEGVADGTEIEATLPFAVMAMAEDAAGWTVGIGQKYDIAFACEEDR